MIGRLLLVLTILGTSFLAAPSASATEFHPPIDGPVVRGFSPPDQDWQPGHRGVDLAGTSGEPVHASAAGLVRFAGRIAGRGVVVVSHGGLRTTYEPVTARVAVGDRVAAGEVLGVLEPGHRCPGSSACLHWGLKRGDQYLNPLSGAAASLRLLPQSAIAVARRLAAQRESVLAGSGRLFRPVPGAIGSPFGMRRHPIFHDLRLHAGVDLRASCGTPIRAADNGRVIHVGYDASGGHRLVLAHAGGLTTHYLHAQRYRVRLGQRVARGAVVGWVGSTGWSTACHLHFTVKVNGQLVDPARWL